MGRSGGRRLHFLSHRPAWRRWKMLGHGAKLIWTVEARSHFEAMTEYYKFMGWGEYTTDQAWDMQPYPEEWSQG